MLRYFVLTLLTAAVVAIDHDVFKDCSRVPFCSNFRNKVADDGSRFSADIHAISSASSVATIPLRNRNGDSLNLQITLLSGNKARVKILEPSHNRYELSDVLDKEPEIIPFTSSFDGDRSVSLLETNDRRQVVVVNSGPPFSVEFYYDDLLEVTLNSERLFIENTDSSQSFSFQVNFEGASKLYGLHHHAYSVALGETADGSSDPFRLKNSDAAFYEVGSTMALYGAVPAVYGHSTRSTSGVFLHNAAEQWVDISYRGSSPSAHFMADSGTLDLFILLGPTPKEVVRQFTDLTGVAHLPPLWALGYHQCRYSYDTQDDVKQVVANMDRNDFPMDAIWLDIDYTNGQRYFTWNPQTFNNPVEMQRNISATGRKLVTIIDPHVKVDDDYAFYSEARSQNYFVKWAAGDNFEDQCWPGLSSYLDFLNPDARNYYASWFSYDRFSGSTETLAGIWNDMNEPSVFDTAYENSMPSEILHYGGVRHRDIHNIYGFLQTMATHQGLLQRDNGSKRPFVLTRSHFAGSQRYAAMWTGDNDAHWPYLAVSYSECMTSNILGMVFCGADIGGFFSNPDVQLLQRWYQAAIWLPFFRSHSEKNTPRREPYLFSEDVQRVIRNAIKLRYSHIPYWYTLFYEHTRYGDPIIRPLFYSYPEVLESDDHVLVGTDILARPVLEPDVSSITVYFPGSEAKWYRADDDSWTIHNGGTSENVAVNINTSPYYYRAGTIIPRREIDRSSTAATERDPFVVYVNLDESNNAYGRLYADDFSTFEYATQNNYFYLNMTYAYDARSVIFSTIDGSPRDMVVSVRTVIVHSMTGQQKTHTTTSDGTPLHTINLAKQLYERKEGITLFL